MRHPQKTPSDGSSNIAYSWSHLRCRRRRRRRRRRHFRHRRHRGCRRRRRRHRRRRRRRHRERRLRHQRRHRRRHRRRRHHRRHQTSPSLSLSSFTSSPLTWLSAGRGCWTRRRDDDDYGDDDGSTSGSKRRLRGLFRVWSVRRWRSSVDVRGAPFHSVLCGRSGRAHIPH